MRKFGFDSYEQEEKEEFKKDSLHYHRIVVFEELKHATQKAYLIRYRGHDIWVPKSLCRKVDLNKKCFYVQRKFWNEKIEELGI